MSQRALITGISGQDGSYLSEFLLAKGYTIYGLVRRSPETLVNLTGILDKVQFLYGDMRDSASLSSAILRSWPDEIYNLAGQPFVPPSWILPEATLDINAVGLARLLYLVEKIKIDTRIYQASSSEMYGNQSGALDESSPMQPTSPYGVSKFCAHHLVQVYRDKGLRVVSGILFNHESPRRGMEMVTRKICRHVARFAAGLQAPLEMGDLSAQRDWGYAPDYVEAMWLMTQEAKTDYVIGTGHCHSVDEFLDRALEAAGLDRQEFREKWLKIDPRLQRRGQIQSLCAKPEKASQEMDWKPKTSFEQMVEQMVQSEAERVK